MWQWLNSAGWLKGLRGVAHHAVALLQTRLELFSIELQIERQRLIIALILVAGTSLFSVFALFVFTFLIIEISWETEWRRHTILLLFFIYLLTAGGFAFTLARMLSRAHRPFAGTLAELRKDREALKVLNK